MKNKNISDEEVDEIVIAEANDSSEWEQPVRVKKTKPASLSIPGELAARATFLARVHGEARVEEWITRIIRERVELEETAFVEAKRDLDTKGPN